MWRGVTVCAVMAGAGFVTGESLRSAQTPAVVAARLADRTPRLEIARRARIQAARRRLEDEVRRFGDGSCWDQWAARSDLVAFRRDLQRWIDADKLEFLTLFEANARFVYSDTALRLVTAGDFTTDTRHPSALETLVQWSTDLRERGIDFIYMPVPTSVEVYPEHASEAVAPGDIVSPYQRRFLHALLEWDVEVIDLLPVFLDVRRESPGELLYQPRDLHWSNTAVQRAAALLATRLSRFAFTPPSAGGRRFETRELAMRTEGEFVSRLPPEVQATYPLVHFAVRQVFLPDGSPYADVGQSPVLVVGDSFSYYYSGTVADHAGFTAQLSYALGFPVSLVGRGGLLPADLRRDLPELLQPERRVVVYIQDARQLYPAAGWRPLSFETDQPGSPAR